MKIIPLIGILLLNSVICCAQNASDDFSVQGVADDNKVYRLSRDSYYRLMEKRKIVEKEVADANALSDREDASYNELIKLKDHADPSNPTSINAYNAKVDEFYQKKDKITIVLKKAIADAIEFNNELKKEALN